MDAGGIIEMAQSTIIETTLRAYPEKRRLIFIHVPKCAGTDLSINLRAKFPATLHQSLTSPGWFPPSALDEALAKFKIAVERSDTILVDGHNTLRWAISADVVRPMDRLFTIVRDPAAAMMSQINYVTSRMMADPSGKAPDVREWLNRSSINDVEGYQAENVAAIASRLVHRNPMCSWLGAGDASSALVMIRQSNIEVTDTSRYKAWGEATWGIPFTTKHNASPRIVSTLPDGALMEHCAEDIALHGAIMKAMGRELSIRGSAV